MTDRPIEAAQTPDERRWSEWCSATDAASAGLASAPPAAATVEVPDERKAFEAHIRARNVFPADRYDDAMCDEYVHYATQFAWDAWQARAALSTPAEGGEPCPRGDDKPEPTCTNRHQCWEPCGELGNSAEHARVFRPTAQKAEGGEVPVPIAMVEKGCLSWSHISFDYSGPLYARPTPAAAADPKPSNIEVLLPEGDPRKVNIVFIDRKPDGTRQVCITVDEASPAAAAPQQLPEARRSPGGVIEERERCARICESLAQIMEWGGGDPEPGGRLRQAAREIRNGDPAPSFWGAGAPSEGEQQ